MFLARSAEEQYLAPRAERYLEERKNVADESGQSEQPQEPLSSKRPGGPAEAQEQKLSPRPSFWPIALALTLSIAALGSIVHVVLFVCGIVLTIIVIVGWILDKR